MKSRNHAVSLGITAALALSGIQSIRSQVVPATPTKFTTRGIGDSTTSGSVGITPAKPQVTTRTVTHIVLGTPRQWKMIDGKSFIGKLIAFEDIVETGGEKKAGPAPAAAPAIPEKPTVVRDGKARFLVNTKPYELALDRLGRDECKFIEEVRAALAAKK